MKKLFLIIAIALFSITSAFAYSVSGSNQMAEYKTNTKRVDFILSQYGYGISYIYADDNKGLGHFCEDVNITSVNDYPQSRTLQDRFIALPNTSIVFIHMEVYSSFGQGTGSVQASW